MSITEFCRKRQDESLGSVNNFIECRQGEGSEGRRVKEERKGKRCCDAQPHPLHCVPKMLIDFIQINKRGSSQWHSVHTFFK